MLPLGQSRLVYRIFEPPFDVKKHQAKVSLSRDVTAGYADPQVPLRLSKVFAETKCTNCQRRSEVRGCHRCDITPLCNMCQKLNCAQLELQIDTRTHRGEGLPDRRQRDASLRSQTPQVLDPLKLRPAHTQASSDCCSLRPSCSRGLFAHLCFRQRSNGFQQPLFSRV